MSDVCQLCGCTAKLTKHHLVPKLKAKGKLKDVKDDASNIIWICRPCHDAVHATYTESELRDSFSTLDALQHASALMKFIAWKRKHPGFAGTSKMGNRKR